VTGARAQERERERERVRERRERVERAREGGEQEKEGASTDIARAAARPDSERRSVVGECSRASRRRPPLSSSRASCVSEPVAAKLT
jgi:hypothetical protein